jgi:DNA-binding transcriptional LysR family regulator
MELDHLRVFFEVAKAGRFTEAAQRLNISQSALSRSVALLEDSEGVKLFERSKRGVNLTPIGAEVFRQCEQMFQTVRRIEQVCRGSQETCEGPLRFVTNDHIVNYLLPRPLRAFLNEYTKVIPSIAIGTPDEILEKLQLTDCEFSLSFAKIAAPQIEFEALREEPMALVVASDVWKSVKGTPPVGKLSKVLERVGYISSIGAHAQTRPSRVLKELFGNMPPISIEVDGQESQKRVCLSGGGIAYLARFMVEREIESGELHEINVETTHSFKLWLAVRKGKDLSLAARTFIEHLRAFWGTKPSF